MFGLMRAKKCGLNEAEKHSRRLHYCGTCKTIGSLYGQKSRLLLNHDTVFLAEILTSLNNEKAKDWQKSYQSFNCLNLPKSEMPVALQFAATANVILMEFKISDHISDEKKQRYKIANRLFSREFQEAERALKMWNFPIENIRTTLQSQEKVESESNSLEDLAHPTAETTARFFAEGVKLIGKNDLENSAYNLGYDFGKLIYLLDAFEDYEKDFRARKFNAFRKSFNLQTAKLPQNIKRKIIANLHQIESRIIEEIFALPIDENRKSIFASRLSDNLREKLKTNLPVLKTPKVCAPKKKLSFAESWRNASVKAKNLARNYSWQMPLVFLFVFAFALVAPAQSREAKSARECFDLSFNLMFLGAVFGAVLAFPKAVMQTFEPPPMPPRQPQQPPPQDESGSWCSSCCDAIDCGDCCCECGCDSCDCCSCDSCDCCSCDC